MKIDFQRNIILALIILIVSSIGISVKASASTSDETRYVTEIKGTETYSSSSSVPKTIEYTEGTLKGTLTLDSTEIFSGDAPKTIEYSENVSYILMDYCIWNSSTGTMNFSDQTGDISWDKTVTKEGKKFVVTLNASQYQLNITKYAAPGYYIRGHKTYTEYGDTFSVSEEPWVGTSKVSNGNTYHTAKHYYKGTYSGSTMSDDTRTYRGIYSGTLTNTEKTDLSITNFEIIDIDNNVVNNVVLNENYRARITVKNLDKKQSITCTLNVYDETDKKTLKDIPIPSLNGYSTTTVILPIKSTPLGQRSIEAFIDSDLKNNESKEDNNKSRLVYQVFLKNNKPIASFEVNPKFTDKGRTLVYNDNSYDPDDWDQIIEREWKWTRIEDVSGKKVVEGENSGSTPPSSFSIYGKYKINLRVKDKGNAASPSLWSEWSTDRYVVIKNMISVNAELIPSQALQGQIVKIKIYTTFSPNKLTIKFPKELVDISNMNTKIDFNTDGIIDDKDLKLINEKLNVSKGNPMWDEKYDLNNDLIINQLDVDIVTVNQGKAITAFDKLEETINFDLIEQDVILTTEYEFLVPIQTELTIDKDGNKIRDPYKFEIVALREIDGEKANTTLMLDVTGSIYSGIRTRLK